MKILSLFTATTLLICLGAAQASTFSEQELTCPLNGRSFTQQTARSGTVFGQMLDLKPVGAIAAPWPLPICPDNGFVIYKKEFTKQEINRLRIFVRSKQYQDLQKDASYYRAAKLKLHMSENLEDIAYTLLQATWQAEDQNQYRLYAAEALAAFKALIKEGAQEEGWAKKQLIAVELERRLSLFYEAQKRINSIKDSNGFKQGRFAQFLMLQSKLIAERDHNEHQAP